MIDFQNTFSESFNTLKNNKRLVFPFLFSSASLYLMIILFVFLSGLYPFIQENYALQKEYSEYTNKEMLKGNFLPIPFEEYSRDKFTHEINFEDPTYLKNIFIYLGISVIVWFLLTTFFHNIGYYTISKELFKEYSKEEASIIKYYFKYLFLVILIFVFTFLPIAIAYLISIYLIYINLILAVVALLISLIFTFVWIIYISLKLFFAVPTLYLESLNRNSNEVSPLESIPMSFNIVKGKLKNVIIIALVVYGITSLANIFSNQPISNLAVSLITSSSIIAQLILITIIFVMIIIQATFAAFIGIFLFKSYLNFKTNLNKEEDIF